MICYSNRAKEVSLGVPAELIEAHGAVSERGRRRDGDRRVRIGSRSELGVSVTGHRRAGRRQRRASRSARTIVGVARRGQPPRVEHRLFAHDRGGNQHAAALAALALALDEVLAGLGRGSRAAACAPGERIHLIGIAGSGAAGVALLLQHAGANVDGCDIDTPSPYTPPLDAAGIRVLAGHDPSHLAGVERVAITPALRADPDLPELVAAQDARPARRHLAGAPGRADGARGPHRPGGHRHARQVDHDRPARPPPDAAGMDPTVEVGAFIPAWGATVRPGGGAPFLVEADEFGDNFLNYHPAGAIVTNVEMDHPDFFADRDAVLASMERFVRGMGEDPRLGGRLLLTTAADHGAQALLERLEAGKGASCGMGLEARSRRRTWPTRAGERPSAYSNIRSNHRWRGSTTC